jgi:hypothetical protein
MDAAINNLLAAAASHSTCGQPNLTHVCVALLSCAPQLHTKLLQNCGVSTTALLC